MTDNTNWHAPDGDPQANQPQPNQPQPFAPPVPPVPPAPPAGYAPLPSYAPPAGYGAPSSPPPGWTPPPRPGLIPLRPLSFGTLLGASFQVMRRNPRPTFGIGLLLNGVLALIFAGIIASITFLTFSRLDSASPQDVDEIGAGAIGIGVIASLIPMALSVVIAGIMQGIISLEVARATLGEKLRFGGLWRLAKGRIGALIGWTAIITGALLIVIVIAAGIVFASVSVGGSAGFIAGFAIVLVFGGLATVASAWIGTKLALVPSVLMLERLSLMAAIRRSWTLTNGYFWKTLGTMLLVNVIVNVATQIITTPVSFIVGIGSSLINPTEDSTLGITLVAVGYVLTLLASLVFGVIGSVLASSVVALIYVDIRMRKEGLDLELTRFVEARQDGDVGVQNPYERLWAPAASQPQYPAPTQPDAPTDASPWT
ncbi:MAG: hypothetical protein ACOH1T_02230 [Microbacteriaceae bacterium]